MLPTSMQSIDSFFDDTASMSRPPGTNLENKIMNDASRDSSGSIISIMGKREQHLGGVADENMDENSKAKKPKAVHKEIERKRRQEMASLHSSLRSLLPLEYIRGKRSISDHIHECVNYIKYLENNIMELSAKRDKLRTISNSNVVSTSSANSINYLPNSVTISLCSGGAEILITSGLGEEVFPLSRVLLVMFKEGFNIASCVSTQANGRLFVAIKSEADISTSDDLSLLKQKLADSIT